MKNIQIKLHSIALIFETFGAILAYLESKRIGETIIQLGFMGYDGPPKEFSAWYYNSGALGFLFVLGGIIFSAAVLYISPIAKFLPPKLHLCRRRIRQTLKNIKAIPFKTSKKKE